jgi:hypothetical protein
MDSAQLNPHSQSSTQALNVPSENESITQLESSPSIDFLDETPETSMKSTPAQHSLEPISISKENLVRALQYLLESQKRFTVSINALTSEKNQLKAKVEELSNTISESSQLSKTASPPPASPSIYTNNPSPSQALNASPSWTYPTHHHSYPWPYYHPQSSHYLPFYHHPSDYKYPSTHQNKRPSHPHTRRESGQSSSNSSGIAPDSSTGAKRTWEMYFSEIERQHQFQRCSPSEYLHHNS